MLTQPLNERPPTAAFSQRRRPGPECGSPETRSRCAGFLRVRGDEIVRTLVNVSVGVVAYVKPFFFLSLERTFCDLPPHTMRNEMHPSNEAALDHPSLHACFLR